MSKYDHPLDMAADNSASLILRRIGARSRVLEFGPASGYMTQYMKQELNCNITCIELNAQDAAMAANYCERMIVADLDDLSWSRQLTGMEFDHIIFADVLEHLRFSPQVLQAAVEFLAHNGTVLTSIPNIGHNAVLMDLLQGKFAYHSLGLLDNTHIRFFTKESILSMLTDAGLSPIEWLGTVVVPEETEFQQNYRNFPESVQNYLLERSEGHVYQYVTVSCKTAAISQSTADQNLEVAESRPDTNNLQLYWEVDAAFTEAHSARQLLKRENEWAEYHFQIPNFSGGRLRIDPGNRPADMALQSITIYSGTQMIKVISSKNKFEGLVEANDVAVLENGAEYRFVCVADDPYLFVEPSHVLATSITIKLRVNTYISNTAEIVKLQQERLKLQNDELYCLREGKRLLTKQLWVVSQKRIMQCIEWMKRGKELLRQGLGLVPGWLATVKLVPIRHIDALPMEDCWKTTGDHPLFRIKGLYPRGWVRISYQSASAQEKVALRLFCGIPTSKDDIRINAEGLWFGVIQPGRPITQHAVVFIDRNAASLYLHPDSDSAQFLLSDVQMLKVTRLFLFYRTFKTFFQINGASIASIKLLWQKTRSAIRANGWHGLWRKVRHKAAANHASANRVDYEAWVQQEQLTLARIREIGGEIEQFAYKPLISVLVPVYNVDEKWLRKCVDSVRNQLYPFWELCIADDASPKLHIRDVLEEYCAIDPRIRVVYRKENGHISAASNTALAIAVGEFAALLDHDDELAKDALYENVKWLNLHPDADMIYSDEDKINSDGKRHSPFFKPDWSPDLLLSQMYTCHLSLYRTSLMRELGGFRIGYEGSQDHDLALRLTEKTDRIEHIPRILYHWRSLPQSTSAGASAKQYTQSAGFRAVSDAIERRGLDGWVEADNEIANVYRVHYRPVNSPLISILIPTRNMGEMLDHCLASIFSKTTYEHFEVLIADNGSDDLRTQEVFAKWQVQEPKRFQTVRMDMPFNYSRLNNQMVQMARGELILMLNNDIEVISGDWLTEMAGQALRAEVGVVGSCLLYPDNTIQHAGVILGLGGIAGHGHKHAAADDPGYFSKLRAIANYSALTGACLMVRKAVYLEVDGLDELLAVAFNDVDFCLKLRAKGYYHVLLPQVKLYHRESKSRGTEDTPAKRARFREETELMRQRWGDLLESDPFYNRNLSLNREDYSLREGEV